MHAMWPFVWRFDEVYYVTEGGMGRVYFVAKHSFDNLMSLLQNAFQNFAVRELFVGSNERPLRNWGGGKSL